MYSIFKKKLFTLIVSKEFITKFQFEHKDYFYLFLLENNEFLQFYLQKYFNLFLFKKIILYKLLKKITLFAKEFLIKKKKKFNLLFLKIAFKPILLMKNNLFKNTFFWTILLKINF